MTFQDLGLRPEILKAISEIGYETPTPIQEQAIPELLQDWRDLVGLAQTGTGKTAAFGLPLIDITKFEENIVQGLVIAPTRELCLQISNDLKAYTKYIDNAKIATIYGGASIDKQAREVKRGAQIVVATPGRLKDMIKRKLVNLNSVEIVVLDEADEMLNMGFKEDIDAILDTTPDHRNVWLFSATMPKEVAKIAKTYMTDPFEITVGTKNSSAKNIKHVYYTIKERDRYYALKRILDFNPNIYGVIFCRTKRLTQDVADKLMHDGYNAEPLHGDLSQSQRDAVMNKFRKKTLQILVATDVAARGIDVNDITHVINYNLPEDNEVYTHRSGRTGRAGKFGVSIAFITGKEFYKIKSIQKQIQKDFEEGVIPSGAEVCREQLYALIDNVKSVEVKEEDISEYLPAIFDQLEDFSKEDIIKRFVSAEFNHLLEYYEKSFDLNYKVSKEDKEKNGSRRDRGRSRNLRDDNQQRFYVNKGTAIGLNKGALLRIVCQNSGLKSAEVGRIDLFKEFTFFNVNKDHAKKVFDGMKSAEFDGHVMKIEFAGEKGGGKSRGGGGGRNERKGDRRGKRRR